MCFMGIVFLNIGCVFGELIVFDSVNFMATRLSLLKSSSRLVSFYYWPSQMKQRGKEMAEAGFFYTGQEDIVICFCCGLARAGWCHFNKAREEHVIVDVESAGEFLKEEKRLRFYRILQCPTE